MGLLKSRELTPAQEAARQAAIEDEIVRQRLAEQDRVRELNAENARRRQAMWNEQQAEAERHRMELMAQEQKQRRDEEERQRQADLQRSQALMAELRAAEERCRVIQQAIGELSQPPDLSSVAAAIRSAERESQVIALRSMLERADAELVRAERATGRHRG